MASCKMYSSQKHVQVSDLMASDGKFLCERLTDMYWGPGLSLYFPNTTKPQYWPGKISLENL